MKTGVSPLHGVTAYVFVEIHAKPMCLFCQKTITAQSVRIFNATMNTCIQSLNKGFFPLDSDIWKNSKHRSMGFKPANRCCAALLKSNDQPHPKAMISLIEK